MSYQQEYERAGAMEALYYRELKENEQLLRIAHQEGNLNMVRKLKLEIEFINKELDNISEINDLLAGVRA